MYAAYPINRISRLAKILPYQWQHFAKEKQSLQAYILDTFKIFSISPSIFLSLKILSIRSILTDTLDKSSNLLSISFANIRWSWDTYIVIQKKMVPWAPICKATHEKHRFKVKRSQGEAPKIIFSLFVFVFSYKSSIIELSLWHWNHGLP